MRNKNPREQRLGPLIHKRLFSTFASTSARPLLPRKKAVESTAFLKMEFSTFRPAVGQGTSIFISLPEKLKLGRFRPFMNFAAVWDNAVMIIGRAIDGSQATNAVVAPLPRRPNWPVCTPP